MSSVAHTLSALMERAIPRWQSCEGIPETTLLRLVILRDLLRELHSERSRCLATGRKEEAQALREREQQLERLRSASPLQGDLETCLKPETALKKRTRLLPDGLFDAIPREKLERFDRTWEAAITAEAVALGWCVWSLEAWVDIAQVEGWQDAVSNRLLPHGVILFAEPAESPPPGDAGGPEGSCWHGRWYVALQPQYRTPDFKIAELPGTAVSADGPRWKRLFAPRTR